MKKSRILVIALLLAFTILNVVVTVPLVLEACDCYKGGEIFCSGDCCGGSSQCNCYDKGTDNCKEAEMLY